MSKVTIEQSTMDGKAEILLVDDHALILEGLRGIFDRLPDVRVADAVTSGKEAVELIKARDYDVYVLDINLPDISGVDLIARIRELNENARIIINTVHEEIWILHKLISLKVSAVVLKSSDATEMTNAVENVLRGDTYACPRFSSIRQKLIPGPSQLHPKDVPTKRELEVLKAVAKGYNTHEVAVALQISENTVETFRKRLIQKFCAKNAIDMVVKAMVKGWIGIEVTE